MHITPEEIDFSWRKEQGLGTFEKLEAGICFMNKFPKEFKETIGGKIIYTYINE